MNVLVVALLDKEYPPSHSFIDGMLAKVVAAQDGISVRLVVSRGVRNQPVRYHRASCVPSLFRRRGLGRVHNLLAAMAAIRRGVRDAERKAARLVVFVRNDPMLLFAAALMRQRYDKLVFQSSYPHEQGPSWSIKHAVARGLYHMSARKIDAITAVSPLGLVRTQQLFPQVRISTVIPLLADLPAAVVSAKRSSGRVRFIYIGTHSPKRHLHVVVQAAVQACSQHSNIEFVFVGGTPQEISAIQAQAGLAAGHERILFKGKVPRSDIPQYLANAEVGLSLIPPHPEYAELSPTKLGEYMAAGLAVLASKGIPLQEQYVEQSEGGKLVEWGQQSITDAILAMTTGQLKTMQKNAYNFSQTELNYYNYYKNFTQLIQHHG